MLVARSLLGHESAAAGRCQAMAEGAATSPAVPEWALAAEPPEVMLAAALEIHHRVAEYHSRCNEVETSMAENTGVSSGGGGGDDSGSETTAAVEPPQLEKSRAEVVVAALELMRVLGEQLLQHTRHRLGGGPEPTKTTLVAWDGEGPQQAERTLHQPPKAQAARGV